MHYFFVGGGEQVEKKVTMRKMKSSYWGLRIMEFVWQLLSSFFFFKFDDGCTFCCRYPCSFFFLFFSCQEASDGFLVC